MRVVRFYSAVALVSIIASTAQAGTILTTDADSDRWVYPFNGSPGFRDKAPTFGAVGGGAFDNFDGQFLVGFNTAAAGVTPLGPGETYQINSITVSATHSTGALTYDPTFDNYATYLDGSDPDFVADSDAGRPIEIYGAGLRGGYASYAFAGGVTGPPFFNEGSPFAFADPTLSGVRNSFAFDPSVGDVSNPVTDDLFSLSPWAIGQAAGLSAGDSVPEGIPGSSAGQTFTFDINLSDPDVLSYLTDGLEDGGLFFTIVSLHGATQTGGTTPNFFTRNSFDPAAIAPSITIDFEIVPEPSTFVLGALGMVGLAVCHIRSRRSKKS